MKIESFEIRVTVNRGKPDEYNSCIALPLTADAECLQEELESFRDGVFFDLRMASDYRFLGSLALVTVTGVPVSK